MPSCEHRQIKEANLELCFYRGIRVQIRFFFPLGGKEPQEETEPPHPCRQQGSLWNNEGFEG